MSIQREKIKLVPGIPMQFILEDTNGRPMTSRFHNGTEYLYSVTYRGGACLLYLPVEGAQALQNAQCRNGDEILLTKIQVPQGQLPRFLVESVYNSAGRRRDVGTTYDELRSAGAPPASPGFQRMLNAPSTDEFDQHMRSLGASPAPAQGGVRMLAPRSQFAPQAAPPPPPAAAHVKYPDPPEGYIPSWAPESAHAAPPLAWTEETSERPQRHTVAQQAAATPSSDAVLLAQCGMSVVDAVMGIEAYATKKGLTLKFGSEDVRAMMLTLVIGAQQRDRGAR